MRIRTILLLAVATTIVAASVLLRGAAVDEPRPPAVATPIAAPRTHAAPRMPALAAVETASDQDRERLHQEAYQSLVAALRSDPAATLAELERFLADADPSKLSTQIAIGALVAVGTPEMQRALVRLVEARATEDDFARGAIPVMAFLQSPTVETEQAIRAFTRDDRSEAMQSTSHLALGIMATHLADDQTARSSAIVADYAARLGSSETTADKKRWLQVLGNARTEAAGAAIERLLGDRDPAIRRTAVEALRLAPGADGKLVASLGDDDVAVRAAAAWSLSHRQATSSTVDAMLARLAGERDDTVVSALLSALWPRRQAAPDRVIAAVRQLAHHHPSTQIRERAQRLLDTGASS
jgi:hypothetical protein